MKRLMVNISNLYDPHSKIVKAIENFRIYTLELCREVYMPDIQHIRDIRLQLHNRLMFESIIITNFRFFNKFLKEL